MASSSTSSVHKSFKYDVFLSFRGEDTRTSFVDHLYHALDQRKIYTYKDDKRIKKGQKISDELIGSIEDSKFYIIVFSKNYASSSWCLDELVKIMECHKMTEHTAYPVFYDVEPSEVRKQSGAVEEAFAKHENEEAAGKWREALKEAVGLAGWELKNTANGHEAELIRRIVEEISLDLGAINFNIDGKLVGMECRIQELVSSLGRGIDDVRMIGIKGMGGGGKTTLARVIFDQISYQFEGKSFVENVREVSNASLSGLKSLQSQVLSNVLNDKGIGVSSVYEGIQLMKRRMANRKVLIVLDDVDHMDQLEALASAPNMFKPGSRIIITTRDEQVLVAHRVKFIHDVNLLSNEEAICLFSRYAFEGDIPIQGYEELSRQVVRYAAGLPLTIRVLGSFLCGKDEVEWIDALERLEKIPLQETQKKLEISYIGLEEDYKEIFLDVACILKGWRKDLAIKVLESCGFHAINGLRVLEQKSLITIYVDSNGHKWLGMHDHIEEMGRNIVRRSHPDKPHKHSRLWIREEIEDIFFNDLGTKATRCLRLDTKKLNPHIVATGLRNMKELRFLSVVFGFSFCNTKSNIVGPYLPNALQYLDFNQYPFRALPKTFLANNLVALKMAHSRIVQLWEGGERKVLHKLRFIDLSCSMLRAFDLGLTPNLEMLTLRRCSDLVELRMPARCLKLIFIDLGDSKLRILDLRLAPNLEELNLVRCHNLEELHMPRRCLNLRSLQLSSSRLRTLHIGLTPNLKSLDLKNCSNLGELHMADKCQKLVNLDISYSKLRTLDLGLTPNLETLDLKECCDLVELHMDGEFQNLAKLNISHSKLRTIDLRLTPNLEKLDLRECCNLVELHTPIRRLEELAHINLSSCLGFKTFSLEINGYTSSRWTESLEVGPLSELQLIVESLERCPFHPDNNLPKFQFSCIYKEDRPSLTRNIQMLISLDMCACTNLERFLGSIGLRHLRTLVLFGNIVEAPKNLDHLECRDRSILWSTKINHLPDSIFMSKHVTSLELDLRLLLEDLGRFEFLEDLTLCSKMLRHLPDSICMLKHLKTLELNSCPLLEMLPEDVGRLECLEFLYLMKCEFLQDIRKSICKMKCLKGLCLMDCNRVERLPEELGCLECLGFLDIRGTSISHLPQSIFLLKGLCIYGSRGLLESYGFASKIQTIATLCYVVVE